MKYFSVVLCKPRGSGIQAFGQNGLLFGPWYGICKNQHDRGAKYRGGTRKETHNGHNSLFHERSLTLLLCSGQRLSVHCVRDLRTASWCLQNDNCYVSWLFLDAVQGDLNYTKLSGNAWRLCASSASLGGCVQSLYKCAWGKRID